MNVTKRAKRNYGRTEWMDDGNGMEGKEGILYSLVVVGIMYFFFFFVRCDIYKKLLA